MSATSKLSRDVLKNDWKWIELSAKFLSENVFCERHKLRRKYIPSQITDHIIPVSVRPDRRYDEDNLQALCKSCHSWKTGKERSLVAYDFRRRIQYSLVGK